MKGRSKGGKGGRTDERREAMKQVGKEESKAKRQKGIEEEGEKDEEEFMD